MLDVRFFANPRFTAASVNVTLVFFALFGFIFLATQYLQFVLGYTRVRGRHPHAAVRVRAHGDGAAVVEGGAVVRHEARRRHRDAAVRVGPGGRVDVDGRLRLRTIVMLAMVLMGAGMGLSVAPATESIMGSLPLHQAGVGSAVNDTSREVGGALGVAIVGSMLSSLYSSNLNAKLPANVPSQVRDAADQSVGAALQVSAQLGRVGAPLADAARESFVYAMSRASLVTAAVAVVGALLGVAVPAGPGRRGARRRRARDRRRTTSWRRRADSVGALACPWTSSSSSSSSSSSCRRPTSSCFFFFFWSSGSRRAGGAVGDGRRPRARSRRARAWAPDRWARPA